MMVPRNRQQAVIRLVLHSERRTPSVCVVPPEDLTLQQAADQLGVHYMTAYRYVKLGLLYAEKQRGSWVISPQDLDNFRDQVSNESDSPAPVENTTLEEALIAGDEPTAWRLVEAAATSTNDPVSIHLDVLSPALHSIGQRWSQGELSIACEHKASAVANRIIARLGTHLSTPGRRRGTVIVGAAPGDVHSIPTAMFADLVRSFGVSVVDLGGSPDVKSFIEAGKRYDDCAVAMSVTGPGHEDAARSAVNELRQAFDDIPIAIGGGAITSEDQAQALGADLWHSDSRAAAKMIADAAANRRQTANAS